MLDFHRAFYIYIYIVFVGIIFKFYPNAYIDFSLRRIIFSQIRFLLI